MAEVQEGGRHRAPFVDFAIWGPYGKTSQKQRAFTTQALTPKGEWTPKRLPGPATFGEWLRCWAVFRAAMLMCRAARPYELDAWVKGIALLMERHPNHWDLIRATEEMMRSDQWDLILEEEAEGKPETLANSEPWGVIIHSSAYNGFNGPRAIWWDRNLTYHLDRRPSASVAPPPAQWQPQQRAIQDKGGKGKGKWGHQDSPKGGGKKGKPSGRGACFICGSLEHLQSECPFADGPAMKGNPSESLGASAKAQAQPKADPGRRPRKGNGDATGSGKRLRKGHQA